MKRALTFVGLKFAEITAAYLVVIQFPYLIGITSDYLGLYLCPATNQINTWLNGVGCLCCIFLAIAFTFIGVVCMVQLVWNAFDYNRGLVRKYMRAYGIQSVMLTILALFVEIVVGSAILMALPYGIGILFAPSNEVYPYPALWFFGLLLLLIMFITGITCFAVWCALPESCIMKWLKHNWELAGKMVNREK